MKERQPLARKHVHSWKISKREILNLERKCGDCSAVQHVEGADAALVIHTPASLLPIIDVEWKEGALPKAPPQDYGMFGGLWP